MGTFLSHFWEAPNDEKDELSESDTDSQDWHEEMQKEYGNPSWSRMMGRGRLSKKKVQVKTISSDNDNDEETVENQSIDEVGISAEIGNEDIENKESADLDNSETREELDNARNNLEEMIDRSNNEKTYVETDDEVTLREIVANLQCPDLIYDEVGFYRRFYRNTVKSVLNDHSKIDKTKVLKTNDSLMKVERTFDLH